MEDTKIEQHAELDPFSINAKSSVELTKNTKGTFWKVKVVTGEEKLIPGLMEAAIKAHKNLNENKEVK